MQVTPNFTKQELSCRHCGEFYNAPRYFAALQKAREILGKPIIINSAHRCSIHNAKIGGAPLSQHKKIAFDINLKNQDRYKLLAALKQAGFTSFGLYKTFIHCDLRIKNNGKGRFWYGAGAKPYWRYL